MRYSQFYDSSVSVLTFGAMRFAPKTRTDDDHFRTGRAALLEALEAGINTIHSSYEYGTRWALTECLKDHPRRHELNHIVKVPSPEYDGQAFDPAYFTGLVDTALSELHTDRIMVAQHLHRGVPKDIIYDSRGDGERLKHYEAVTSALAETADGLRRAGKLAGLATFPHTMGYFDRAVDDDRFDSVVSFFGPLETDIAAYFDRMAGRKAYFAMRPYMQGILSDKRGGLAGLKADPTYQTEAWRPYLERMARIDALGVREGMSWESFALRFAMTPGIVPSVILSLNKPEYVRNAVEAAEAGPLASGVVGQVYRACADIPVVS